MPPAHLDPATAARTLFAATVQEARRTAGFEGAGVPLGDVALALGQGTGTLRLLAAGKAARTMLEGFRAQLRVRLGTDTFFTEGLLVAPHGTNVRNLGTHVDARTAGHPVPDAASEAAGRAALAFAARCAPCDVLVVLLSGGASSLLAAPRAGLTREDLTRVTGLLLARGAPIEALNTVRRRLSATAAGRLAEAAGHAHVFAYVLPDVWLTRPRQRVHGRWNRGVPDLRPFVGSGPTVPLTPGEDAAAIADRYHLWDALPRAAHAYLREAPPPPPVWGTWPPPPPPRAPTTLLQAGVGGLAASRLRALWGGWRLSHFAEPVLGDAATAGLQLADALRHVRDHSILIWQGETTVPLPPGAGVGGRCQQLALSAARALATSPRPVALLAAGTDGVDGPTDAAGAVVTEHTWRAIRAAGMDPLGALLRCNAYPALDAVRALVRTGPTGTNVADVMIGVVGGPA